MHRDDDHLRYKLNNPLTIVVVAVVVFIKHQKSSITFFSFDFTFDTVFSLRYRQWVKECVANAYICL